MSQPAHSEVVLRGIRVVYLERGRTVDGVADFLSIVNELWTLCTDLQALLDPTGQGTQSPEDAAEAVTQPLRAMTARLLQALTERTAETRVPQSVTGPFPPDPIAAINDALNALAKHLSPAKVREIARSPHPTWMLSVALHLDEAAPLAAAVTDQLTSYGDLSAQGHPTHLISSALSELSATLRAAAGDAALPLEKTLHLHHFSVTPAMDIIATVHSYDPRLAQAMYLLAKIIRQPRSVNSWLPQWIDERLPQPGDGGAWERILGGPIPRREPPTALTQQIIALALELQEVPRDVIVAGLGAPPPDLV